MSLERLLQRSKICLSSPEKITDRRDSQRIQSCPTHTTGMTSAPPLTQPQILLSKDHTFPKKNSRKVTDGGQLLHCTDPLLLSFSQGRCEREKSHGMTAYTCPVLALVLSDVLWQPKRLHLLLKCFGHRYWQSGEQEQKGLCFFGRPAS